MTIVTLHDAGKTISLTVSDTLEARLEAQSGTGYRWEADPDSTPLLKLETTGYEDATKLTGGPVTAVLTFKAASTGHGMLKLSYRRSWEEGAAAKNFSLAVTVI